MHILFAEDSPMVAKPIIKALEEGGHRVTHVPDGATAVKQYLLEEPDLVLMDVVMPIMDGIEATRKIKAIHSKKWVPITMLTSLTSNVDLIQGLEAGADDYLTKPINFEVLNARMRSKQRIVDMQNSFFGVLENVHEGILTIDQHGLIQRFNLAAEKIFGYTPGEVMGCNVNMLMPEPYKAQHDGYLHNYLTTHTPKVIGIGRKVQGRRKNGEVFPMHLAVTQVESVRGMQFIGLVRDISQEEADRQRIEHMALHDVLTGLPNRANFTNHLSATVGRCKPFAVLFIDIDGFKPINDNFGHDIGDMVLIEIAQRLRTAVAEEGFIARLGGDEFVVILFNAGAQQAVEKIGGAILREIGAAMNCGGNNCNVGASIGAAIYPKNGLNEEVILNAADNAMYQAKRAGKNRVVMAEENTSVVSLNEHQSATAPANLVG
jgi:diguanylate cyclase (GGDEF)-like protein/PAS domain S-box-containing protein